MLKLINTRSVLVLRCTQTIHLLVETGLRQSMHLNPGSPGRCRSTGATTTPPAARSTSVTPRRPATRTPRADGSRRPAGSRPSRASMSSTSPAASSTWPPPPRSQRAVHDRDGDQDALYRPRLNRPPRSRLQLTIEATMTLRCFYSGSTARFLAWL